MTEKLIRQGKDGRTEVAVLISHGFGAGWSTWNRECEEALLFEKKLVECVLAANGDEDAVRDGVTQILETLGLEDVYVGGCDGLNVHWVAEGASFIVHEYDGSESISFKDSFSWVTA